MTASDITFTVIIPTYSRPAALRRCLAAVTRLDYPAYDVIVVDDGSPPESAVDTVVAEWPTVHYIRQENAGPAAARNRGADRATGDYLAFLDDDCVPHSGWLTQFARQFRQTPAHLLGGYTENGLVDNPYASASQHLIDYLYASDMPFFTTNNMACPRREFMTIGGFNTRFQLAAGEDREFCARWLAHGHELSYVPAARVSHYHTMTLRDFWRQNWQYGRGAQQLRLELARQNISPAAAPPNFYINLLRYPLQTPAGTFSRWRLLMLFMLSQIAVTGGYLYQKCYT